MGCLSSDRLLTETEAARNLRCSPYTLKRWRKKGTGPTYIKMGRLVRYRETDVFEFVKAQAKQQPERFSDSRGYEPAPWACQQEHEHTQGCLEDLYDMPPHVPEFFNWRGIVG